MHFTSEFTYVFCKIIEINPAYLSTQHYLFVIFLTDMDSVLYEVGINLFYVTQMDLPHSVGLHTAAPC
jgi:hypothetical protein